MSCLLSQFRKTVLGWSSLQTAEFMIIAIKVILSVCFYLDLRQNRIESPNLFSIIFQMGVFITCNIFTPQC